MEQVLAEKGLNQKVLPSDDGRSESTRNYQCQIEIFKRYLGTRLFNSSPLDLISAHISQSLLIANEISQAQDRLTELLQNVYASYPQYMEVVRMIHSTADGGEGDVGQRICHPFSQVTQLKTNEKLICALDGESLLAMEELRVFGSRGPHLLRELLFGL